MHKECSNLPSYYKFFFTHTDAELSVRASFNDTRCDGGSVCPTDPLFFTCEITESGNTQATVKFPSDMTIILLSTDMIVGDPPNGVTVFHNVTINDTHDFTLSLAIETASLLNGGMITCDSAVSGEVDMAGCPVAGEFLMFGVIHYNSLNYYSQASILC